MYSENARKESMRTWRRLKENLGVFSYYAKRHKSVYISVNNNANFKKFWILSILTIWDGLNQKTISRYCPFKPSAGVFFDVLRMFDFSGVALLTSRSTRATTPSFLAFPLRWLHGLYYVV